jgi:hypothetical protein
MLIFSAIGMVGFLLLILSWLYGDFRAAPEGAEPVWSSSRVVATFVTVFGSAGAIALSRGVNVLLSVVIGVFAGYAAGYAVLRWVRFVHRRDARLLAEQEAREDTPNDPT